MTWEAHPPPPKPIQTKPAHKVPLQSGLLVISTAAPLHDTVPF